MEGYLGLTGKSSALRSPLCLFSMRLCAMMFPTLLAMGDAPTISIERGSKKALRASLFEAMISADVCPAFKLGQAHALASYAPLDLRLDGCASCSLTRDSMYSFTFSSLYLLASRCLCRCSMIVLSRFSMVNGFTM